MDGTNQKQVDGCLGAEAWVLDSLFSLGGVYRLGQENCLYFDGSRPLESAQGSSSSQGQKLWHKHGRCAKWLVMLVDGGPQQFRIFKQRWRHRESGATVHSRPPDDPELVRYCTLIVFLRIWAWIGSASGICNSREVFETLEDCGSRRTVQRWLAKLVENGMEFHQAIRLAIIAEVEPRPVESLFDSGLSPPPDIGRKRWKSPTEIGIIYQGCAMLLVAARELALHGAHLLAGARRRTPNAEKTFGI